MTERMKLSIESVTWVYFDQLNLYEKNILRTIDWCEDRIGEMDDQWGFTLHDGRPGFYFADNDIAFEFALLFRGKGE